VQIGYFLDRVNCRVLINYDCFAVGGVETAAVAQSPNFKLPGEGFYHSAVLLDLVAVEASVVRGSAVRVKGKFFRGRHKFIPGPGPVGGRRRIWYLCVIEHFLVVIKQ